MMAIMCLLDHPSDDAQDRAGHMLDHSAAARSRCEQFRSSAR
jgi:hypothetical protein